MNCMHIKDIASVMLFPRLTKSIRATSSRGKVEFWSAAIMAGEIPHMIRALAIQARHGPEQSGLGDGA